MLLEYERKVKFPDTSGQAKQKIQSKTIVMLMATAKAKAYLRWLPQRFAEQ